MITSNRFIGIIAFISLLSITAAAQQLQPYPVDTIDGKAFYKYSVQKSEGLWRISRNFEVTQEEIIKYNPGIEQGVKLGQTLLIPVVIPFDSSAYIIHEVQPKETLYSLSKQYNIRTQQIKDLNPGIKSNKLIIGQRLLIAPKQKTEERQAIENNVIVAQEQKGSKKENQQIKNEDFELKIDKDILKSADKLVETRVDTTTKQIVAIAIDTVNATPADTPTINPAYPDSNINIIIEPRQTPIRIACLLPFMSNQLKRHNDIDRFVDFYEGILLAVNQAQKQGQLFEIYTYDTEKSTHKLENILKEPALQNIDAIIGPAYPSQVAIISNFAFSNHIPALIPFTGHVSDIERNPYLLQFNANARQEADELVNWMKQQTDSVHCVIIDNTEEEKSTSIQYLKLAIIDSKLPLTTTSIQALSNNTIYEQLKADKQNIIIFQSDKFKSIEPYIPTLKSLSGKFNIRLLSQYSWQKENISLPQVYTSVFNKSKLIDFSLMSYMQQYRRYFGHELSSNLPRYDLLGYDLTTFLIRMLQQDGELDMQDKIERSDISGLQSEIVMRKVGENGGFQNKGVQVMTK